MLNNDELHIRLRKNQNTLSVIGLGVIVFGVWSVIKIVLYTALDNDGLVASSLRGNLDRWVFWIMMGIFLAADLGLRLHVGLSAMAEGRGGSPRKAYIVLTFLMALVSFALFAAGMVGLWFSDSLEISIGVSLVSSIVDATSCVLLFEMAVSAIQVKRLRKTLGEEEA
ncbi:MAG: hypothetical protein IJ206_06855 [Oscillospiraceae bacterium]|nr:hypothetical protein [Oscillospiraceae bacterium]